MPEVYDYKPFKECLALNKKKNGWTLIEQSPEENAAEQSVQLTAFGVGWRARLGNYLIRLGCRLAKVGGN